jgi:F-type H+-transporting ATPase subunit a
MGNVSGEKLYWEWGFVQFNSTILFTWIVMAILASGSWLITRNLSTGPKISRWQNFLEIIVEYTCEQIRQITRQNPDPYLAFIGTLFLFVGFSNAMTVVPGFEAPTGSLSTTTALAVCVFIAVPLYGCASQGFLGYMKRYVQPNVIMLPFNIIGDLSRTLALAVRLFGNVMSGARIGAILLAIVPIFVPVVMDILGLLTGLIQAYIFAILAMVYIASGVREEQPPDVPPQGCDESSSP